MAQISHADKEIKLKVVFYGPALSGKTTNLIYCHQVLFPNQKVKLFSINTGDDRTLFFDLLPLELGVIKGYNLKLQLFTVPGQVRYNQTRRAVLTKADGVVFVADSRRQELDSNQESLDNMKENLKANHLDFNSIPLVFQYNKQDLEDVYPPAELDGILNNRQSPYFGAIAVTGVGVLQTLKQSILQVLASFNRAFPEFSVSAIEEKIDLSFEAVLEAYQKKTRPPLVPEGAEGAAPLPTGNFHNVKVMEKRDEITQSKLVEKAVETNIEMVELYNELNSIKNLVDQKNRQLTILSQINQALTESFNPEMLPRMIFKSILMTFQTSAGSMLVLNQTNDRMAEAFISGFNRDPLGNFQIQSGISAAEFLLQKRKPLCFNVFSVEDDSLFGKDHAALATEMKKLKIMAFMSVPIQSAGKDYGLVSVYQMLNESSVLKAYGSEDLDFFSHLATPVSLAFEKLETARRLKDSDKSTDSRIEKETVTLREQLKLLLIQNREYQYRMNSLITVLAPLIKLDMRRDSSVRAFNSEVSQPVSSMLMSAKILEKFGFGNTDNVQKFLNVIREESGKLSRTINSFEAGTERYFTSDDFIVEVFPFRDLLVTARDLFMPMIRKKNIEWRDSLPMDLPPVRGDKEKLQYVLNQLIDNALQYTSNGFLELKVQYDPVYNDRFLVVSLNDSGNGISKENLPRLFDRFFRIEGHFDTEKAHFGLGLALSKEIIESGGGRIWAKSEENIGTTVFMELPVQQP